MTLSVALSTGAGPAMWSLVGACAFAAPSPPAIATPAIAARETQRRIFIELSCLADSRHSLRDRQRSRGFGFDRLLPAIDDVEKRLRFLAEREMPGAIDDVE